MRNEKITLLVSAIVFIATPAFAMLKEEGEVAGERVKSSPINIKNNIEKNIERTNSQELPELPTLSKKKPDSERNKSTKTLPLGRKSSGKRVSAKTSLSLSEATSLSPQGGRKCSPRTSGPSSLITTSLFQDEQSRSPGRDESPMRLLERKSSSHEEQSKSQESPRAGLLDSPGRIASSSQQDRELSPMREQNNILSSSEFIGSAGENNSVIWSRQKGSKEGTQKIVISLTEHEKQEIREWGALLDQKKRFQEEENALSKSQSTPSQEQELDPSKCSLAVDVIFPTKEDDIVHSL